MTKIKILLMLYVFTSFSTASFAAIKAGHPRIWIDDTIKARLQTDAAANTPEWLALKAYCDTTLDSYNAGSGYHYNNWYKNVMSYGLCFQATGNQYYGNEGVKYLTGLLRDGADSGVLGDGLGGDSGITKDSGYVSRSAGTGVAIGRDWLDGATDLTPALITEANTRMSTWSSWILANAHAIDDPRDNYFYGHFAMHYAAGLSFFGDPVYNPALLAQAESMWTNSVLPLVEGGFYDGGDWSKGWNYAPWSYEELVGYMLARDTATDDSDPWGATNIYNDLVKSQIHFLYPNRGQFSDNGMWSADVKGDPRTSTSRFLASMTPLDATSKGLLKWRIDNLTYEPNQAELWQKFFYKTSDITPIVPTEANMGGLSYSTAIGHALGRSAGWSDTAATMTEFFAYTDRKAGVNQTTNGDYNVGDMRIFSRGVSLVADGDREQFTGHYQNQLMVTGKHPYAPYQEPWLSGKSGVTGYPVLALSTDYGTGYSYAKVKNAQNAYDGTYWTNTPSLLKYTRSQLSIWPDIVVVFDNATASSASNDVSVRWWFPRLPTVSGQTLTTTDPAVDMKMTVLGNVGSFSPPGSSQDLMAVTGTSTYRPGYYYVDYQTTGAPISNQIITVFSITNHDAAASQVSVVDDSGVGLNNKSLNARGVVVGDTVVMFATDSSGSPIPAFSYQVNAKSHYIEELPPNSQIVVTKNGVEISESPILSSEAGLVKFMTEDGFANYAISVYDTMPPRTLKK